MQVVWGSVPARSITIWARDIDGYYGARIATAIPQQATAFYAWDEPADIGLCPFASMEGEDFRDQYRVWLGLTWIGPDGRPPYNLYRIRRNAVWEGTEFERDFVDQRFRPERVMRF